MTQETQETQQTPDLFQYLFDLWVKDLGEDDADVQKVGHSWVQLFIAFARRVLAENQPVGTDFTNVGLAVRLQDATILPLVAGPARPGMGGVPGCVPITEPEKPRLVLGREMPKTQSFNITGGS